MAFDIHTPSPDDGHEAIRLAVVAAIAQLGEASSGVGDAYLFADLLFGMVDGLYTANVDLQAQIDDLTARVTALEPVAEPEPDEPPADEVPDDVPPTDPTPEVAP